MKRSFHKSRRGELGLSLIEILIVMGVIALLSAISLPYIYGDRKLYKSEDQTLKVIDLMREASQLAPNVTYNYVKVGTGGSGSCYAAAIASTAWTRVNGGPYTNGRYAFAGDN